jgi:uncharacterized membrane protein YciS (DUF1049 family)
MIQKPGNLVVLSILNDIVVVGGLGEKTEVTQKTIAAAGTYTTNRLSVRLALIFGIDFMVGVVITIAIATVAVGSSRDNDSTESKSENSRELHCLEL